MINYDINERGKIVISKWPQKQGTITSNLQIFHSKLSDSGNYTCSPSGARPMSIYVHVLEGKLYGNCNQNDVVVDYYYHHHHKHNNLFNLSLYLYLCFSHYYDLNFNLRVNDHFTCVTIDCVSEVDSWNKEMVMIIAGKQNSLSLSRYLFIYLSIYHHLVARQPIRLTANQTLPYI